MEGLASFLLSVRCRTLDVDFTSESHLYDALEVDACFQQKCPSRS
jgi:hypothetical protein